MEHVLWKQGVAVCQSTGKNLNVTGVRVRLDLPVKRACGEYRGWPLCSMYSVGTARVTTLPTSVLSEGVTALNNAILLVDNACSHNTVFSMT